MQNILKKSINMLKMNKKKFSILNGSIKMLYKTFKELTLTIKKTLIDRACLIQFNEPCR